MTCAGGVAQNPPIPRPLPPTPQGGKGCKASSFSSFPRPGGRKADRRSEGWGDSEAQGHSRLWGQHGFPYAPVCFVTASGATAAILILGPVTHKERGR